MKSKMLLLVSIGALALGASAQNVNAGYIRGSVRQANAISKSASVTDASSGVGATVVIGVIDPRRPRNASNKWATGASSDGVSLRQPNAIGKSASPAGGQTAKANVDTTHATFSQNHPTMDQSGNSPVIGPSAINGLPVAKE